MAKPETVELPLRHLATVNLWRNPDMSLSVTFAEANGVAEEIAGCGARHIDEQDFAEVAHHTHACQGCGLVWRLLPGYKNADSLLAKLQEVVDFYDALPTEHAPGEVELLDSITALIAKASTPTDKAAGQ